MMTASAPRVQKLAGSVLNQGTNVEMAADGFNDATLFVSTAYAARNTGIPFMVLKHRMLTEGHTLSEAIRMSRPELDAMLEMERARTKARAVVSRLLG
jgi:cysteine sulfinate desulfinase/cysteine desulfurase-like protein